MNHLSAANCRSCRESSLWTVSSGPTLFVRVSVPVYRVGRVNIGTHAWFVFLRPCTTPIRRLCDCQRLGSACTPTNFPRMSLIWAYQRAPPDQRVTSEDSDLASLINTGWSESEPVAHWLFLKTLYPGLLAKPIKPIITYNFVSNL